MIFRTGTATWKGGVAPLYQCARVCTRREHGTHSSSERARAWAGKPACGLGLGCRRGPQGQGLHFSEGSILGAQFPASLIKGLPRIASSQCILLRSMGILSPHLNELRVAL